MPEQEQTPATIVARVAVIDPVVAAKAVLAFYGDDDSKWTQEWYAREAGGNLVDSDSPRATCWCVMGATEKLFGVGVHTNVFYHAIERVVGKAAWTGEWHDLRTTTAADVRRVLQQVAAGL